MSKTTGSFLCCFFPSFLQALLGFQGDKEEVGPVKTPIHPTNPLYQNSFLFYFVVKASKSVK